MVLSFCVMWGRLCPSCATILCSRTCGTVPSWHVRLTLAAVGSRASLWHGSRRGTGPHPHHLPYAGEGESLAPTDGWTGVREPILRMPPPARPGALVVDADAYWCRVPWRVCRSRHLSILTGSWLRVASRKAPAAAENTEALNGALTPKPRVMPSANATNSSPLPAATFRVWKPTMRARPHVTSASVTPQPSAGIQGVGRYGFSCAAYARKWSKVPQATLRVPGGPHQPRRSVTAARKVPPKASRAYTVMA